MRLISCFNAIAICIAASIVGSPAPAVAGCFDWLCGRKQPQPAYPVGPPVPVSQSSGYAAYPAAQVPANTSYYAPPRYSASYGNYYGQQMPVIGVAGAGYTTPPPAGVVAGALPSTVSRVPDYRTSAYRAPVTYYRPILTTDPNTGAQVVSLAPCSSYEYQTNRVPTLGRNEIYNSSIAPTVQPAPTALPTYTLPSGGVPLAQQTPPSTPYTSAYRSYSPPQPATTPSVGNYPSTMGSTGGGCVGSYAYPQNTPSANSTPPSVSPPPATLPQSPNTTRTPAPTWGQKTSPPNSATQPNSGSVTPPAATTPPAGVFPQGSDNRGDVPPTLPPGFGGGANNSSNNDFGTNSQSSAMVSPPAVPSSERSLTSSPKSPRYPSMPARQHTSESNQDHREQDIPQLLPIPAPDDFQIEPSWNPGLLKEGDMTALRPIPNEDTRLVAQSKTIQWASFDEVRQVAKPVYDSSSRLRPIEHRQQSISADAATAPTNQPRVVSASPPSRYNATGWRSSK